MLELRERKESQEKEQAFLSVKIACASELQYEVSQWALEVTIVNVVEA